ncbi:hypothetical protein BASA81_001870 [Batrachochytrium salamandrivorans]|nr:hypothetical protein BASA81_001870 [Batrachochytrium salamandrivorans]
MHHHHLPDDAGQKDFQSSSNDEDKPLTATNKRKPATSTTAKPAKRKNTLKNQDDDSDLEGEEELGTRFRWTDELHQYFLSCIFELGLEAASPKKIFVKMLSNPTFAKTLLDQEMLERMFDTQQNGGVLSTTTTAATAGSKAFLPSHVKSHLQRFRSNVPNPKQAFVQQVVDLMEEAKQKHTNDKHHHHASKVLNPQFHAYPFTAHRSFPDAQLVVSNGNGTRLGHHLPPPSSTGLSINTPLFTAATFSGELQMLDPSMLLSTSTTTAAAASSSMAMLLPPPSLSSSSAPSMAYASSSSSTAAAAAAAAAATASSSLAGGGGGVIPDIAQKMQIQTELRQQIELRFQDSLVANLDFHQHGPSSHAQLLFTNQGYGGNISPPTTTAMAMGNGSGAHAVLSAGAGGTSMSGLDDDNLFEWLEAPDDFFVSSLNEDL